MRKLIVAEFITLDGYIAKTNGEMDFFNSNNDEKIFQEMVNTQLGWDTLLLGRVTYQTLVGFWPNSKNEKDPVAAFMNSVKKVVVSKTLTEVPWGNWNNASLINKNIADEIQKLKKQKGKDIAVLGSAGLIQTLIHLQLVDEYSLLVYPIVLGNGKPLFKDITAPHNLKLLESKSFEKSGIVKLHYAMK